MTNWVTRPTRSVQCGDGQNVFTNACVGNFNEKSVEKKPQNTRKRSAKDKYVTMLTNKRPVTDRNNILKRHAAGGRVDHSYRDLCVGMPHAVSA